MLCPGTDAKVPTEQESHADRPVPSAMEPGSQLVHSVPPIVFMNVPLSQDVHDNDPGEDEYSPKGQNWHFVSSTVAVESVARYIPALQGKHTPVPSSWDEPAGQGVHVVRPVAPGAVPDPIEHTSHDVTSKPLSPTALACPSAHGMH